MFRIKIVQFVYVFQRPDDIGDDRSYVLLDLEANTHPFQRQYYVGEDYVRIDSSSFTASATSCDESAGFFAISMTDIVPLSLLYLGRYLPAWRMNQIGVYSVSLRKRASRKGNIKRLCTP